MKNKKRRLEALSFYDHTGIENHLADMAREGWMIESISNICWTYRKIEPAELKFTVSYCPKASDFDPAPSEAQQTLLDFCKETGWELVCTWFQMQVFCNSGADPVPINTDPAIEVATLHRACKASYLRGYILLLVLSSIGVFFFGSSVISDTLRIIASPSDLTTGVCIAALFLLSLAELVTYFTWHRRAKKMAAHGIFLDTPSTSKFQKVILGTVLLAVLYWFANLVFGQNTVMIWISLAVFICIFAAIVLTNAIKQMLKKGDAPAGVNGILTVIASFVISFVLFGTVLSISVFVFSDMPKEELAWDGEVPLEISDLIDTEYSDYLTTVSTDSSVFLDRMEFNHRHGFEDEASADIPEMNCEIYTVKVPGIYGFCKWRLGRQGIIEKYWKAELLPVESEPWGAEEAYRFAADGSAPMFLLCYQNKLLRIELTWEPTPENMAAVGEMLKD